ncbi:MAG: hypothetical protein P8179_10255 [Candidatus Thiodiazotropha sp.]|jgi:hypothetical protein
MTIESIFLKIRPLLLEWSGQLIFLGLTRSVYGRFYFEQIEESTDKALFRVLAISTACRYNAVTAMLISHNQR